MLTIDLNADFCKGLQHLHKQLSFIVDQNNTYRLRFVSLFIMRPTVMSEG